ncbi:MAG: NAD-dependent epimerase/dehydratase family protein [Chloroflexi bacterium]|nr:NAD-dependent epimerase/dehydratase family protein [Chloroflexota bacterium]
MEMHNARCTCRNCPAADFGANKRSIGPAIIACHRRPEIGFVDPETITFEECPQWRSTPYGYLLQNMRVMILGIDGYLGWTLALWLGTLGCEISGVDNYARRDWVKERGAHTVVPISRMTERLRAANEVLGIEVNFRELDIFNDRDRLQEFIDEIKPEAIVYYGECPSAPYSMIDVEHASYVQQNNVLGTLGVLFMMRDLVPQTSLVKLGTMGEYGTPPTGRPLFEGMFPDEAILRWNDREWNLGGEITPRDPGSFYHLSKVHDTFNTAKACRFWGLRSYDIMQGVIYGVNTPQVAADPRLRTRLDIDEWFGTVINRFVAQAVVGFPLTIYGSGEQIRGFIGLEDGMQCVTRLIAHPPAPAQYDVVNQMSGFNSIKQLADTVARIASKEFHIPVTIQRVENPRVEYDVHPYEPIYNKLPEQFGFEPRVQLDDEIYRMLELLTQPDIKQRIEEKKHLILPRTWWSGEKKLVESLEIIEEIKYEASA